MGIYMNFPSAVPEQLIRGGFTWWWTEPIIFEEEEMPPTASAV